VRACNYGGRRRREEREINGRGRGGKQGGGVLEARMGAIKWGVGKGRHEDKMCIECGGGH
jgi:hypothetical protein